LTSGLMTLPNIVKACRSGIWKRQRVCDNQTLLA